MSRIDDIWAAYYKGQADHEKDGPLDYAVHYGMAHPMAAVMSIFGTTDEQYAYEKGYEGDELELCYECEHVIENCVCEKGSSSNESYSDSSSISDNYESSGGSDSSSGYAGSSSSSSTSSGGCIVPLIIVIVVIGGVIWLGKSGLDRYRETKRWGQNQEVWTMMGVNANQLNVRSGPGTDSPVVAKFGRGARLAMTGEPVMHGNERWVRVSTDDGKVQGWAVLKFLSTAPQLDEPQGQVTAEVPQENNDTGASSDNALREKCQELIDRSFRELAVEIPAECNKQLEDHYRRLRENNNSRYGK